MAKRTATGRKKPAPPPNKGKGRPLDDKPKTPKQDEMYKLDTAEKRLKVINELKYRTNGNILGAAINIGMARQSIYDRMDDDQQFKDEIEAAVKFGKGYFKATTWQNAKTLIREGIDDLLETEASMRDPKKVDMYTKRAGEMAGELGTGTNITIGDTDDAPKRVEVVKPVAVKPDPAMFDIDVKALREKMKAEAYDNIAETDDRDLNAARDKHSETDADA